MTSAVDICNLALSHIRAASINSLTENSVQAFQCSLKYPELRDQMLENSPWKFNHSVKPLALLADTEVFNWAYVYQYPSDCLYINQLYPNFPIASSANGVSAVSSRFYDPGLPQPNLDFKVEYKVYNVDDNIVIASNECELRIDYRKRVVDPNLFSKNAVMALSHLLASELAVPLVGADKGRGLRSDELQIYNTYITAAEENDLNEQYTRVPDSEYITVRS